MPLTFTESDFTEPQAAEPLKFDESDFEEKPDASKIQVSPQDRWRASGGIDPLANTSTFLSAIAEDKGRQLPAFVAGAAAMPFQMIGKPLAAAAQDAAAVIAGNPSGAGNIEDWWNKTGADETPSPFEQTLRDTSKGHPVSTVGAKIANGIVENAPMMAAGLPAGLAGRLVSAGFSAQMIAGANEASKRLGEEMGKNPEDRDADAITSAVSDLTQSLVFAPLAGKHAALPDAKITALARELKNSPVAITDAGAKPLVEQATPRPKEGYTFTAGDFAESSEPAEPAAPTAGAASDEFKTTLTPALMVDGKPVTGGATHSQIVENSGKHAMETKDPAAIDLWDKLLAANNRDEDHVFLDEMGDVKTRTEAMPILKKITGKEPTEPVQSQHIPPESMGSTTYDPAVLHKAAPIAKTIGVTLDGVQPGYMGEPKTLQFTWRAKNGDVPKGSPLDGVTFNAPENATPAEIMAIAKDRAKLYGVPDYKQEAAPVKKIEEPNILVKPSPLNKNVGTTEKVNQPAAHTEVVREDPAGIHGSRYITAVVDGHPWKIRIADHPAGQSSAQPLPEVSKSRTQEVLSRATVKNPNPFTLEWISSDPSKISFEDVVEAIKKHVSNEFFTHEDAKYGGSVDVKGDTKEPTAEVEGDFKKSALAPGESADINSGFLGELGMGGAKVGETSPNPQTPTSIKNATVEQERAKRGLPPAIAPARRDFGRVWDEAMAAVDQDPGLPERLVDDLKAKPKALTDAEDAILLHRQITLQNDYGRLTRDLAIAHDDATEFPNRLDDVAELKARLAGVTDQLFDLYEVNKKVGTETGRGLNARKMMAYEDYTLAQMELSKRAAKGGAPLTDEERAQLTKQQAEIERLQTAFDAAEAKAKQAVSEVEAQKAVNEVLKTVPPVEPHIRIIADKISKYFEGRAADAQKYLSGKTFSYEAALPKLIDLGVSTYLKGAADFVSWSSKMLEQLHKSIEPHLKDLYERTQKALDEHTLKTVAPQNVPKVRRMLKTAPVEDRIKATQTAVEEKVKAGKKDEISGQVQKLARLFVEQGVKDRDELIDKVHGVLKTFDPAMTRRDTMDAISGYGDFSPLSKDKISTQLRDLKGQMQQVAKLEDIQARTPPLKTGVERRTPSDEERHLIKQVNDAKRRFGIVVTDPTTQLKSALQSRKTYYQNQIKDLDAQIAQNQKFIRSPAPSPSDAELVKLKARRDELKKQYNEVFPTPELTDAEHLAIALKSADRQIIELERQLKTGEVFPKGKTPPVTSPEIEAKRAKLDALKDQRDWVRDTIQPKPDKDPEAIALKSLKKRMQTQIDSLQARLETGDFGPRTKPPGVKLDAPALETKAKLERAKAEFQRGLEADRLAKRTWYEKWLDTAVKWRRGFVLSSPVTLAKLTAAAIQRIAITPVEEAIGGAIGKVVPSLAKAAPREGGLNTQAEAKSITEAFTTGMKDAWQTLTTGASDLDVLYGHGREGYVREAMTLPRSVIDFFGQLHGALKAPTKRAEFARSFEKRTAAMIRDGIDVTDPMVQTRLAVESYKDASRSIFLQDNRVVTAYKMWLSGIEAKNKATGQPSVGGRALGAAARIALPIVRVPTNLVAETFTYAFGSLSGGAKLAHALSKGIETLKPEEADMILRHLKKGSLGAAMMLAGFLLPNFIGGYYVSGQKRDPKDVKIGSIKIGDWNVPSFLLHNPLLETLQLGATIRRVADSKLRGEKRGIPAGLMAGGLGLTEEVPFVREMFGELPKLFNNNERSAFLGETLKGIVVPQALQWLATYTDKTKEGETMPRKPATLLQHIETGIPGLRKSVPKKNVMQE